MTNNMTTRRTKRYQKKTVKKNKHKYINIKKKNGVAKIDNKNTKRVYKTKKRSLSNGKLNNLVQKHSIGGGLFSSSSNGKEEAKKPEKTKDDIAIIFLNTIRQGSVAGIKDFLLKNNKENTRNLEVKTITGILKSNSYYNIYPSDESYYKGIIDKAVDYDLSKYKNPNQSKNTSSKSNAKPTNTTPPPNSEAMSFEAFQKASKRGNASVAPYLEGNERNAIEKAQITLDDKINKLVKYVLIAMYIKHSFIKYLLQKYEEHTKAITNATNNNKITVKSNIERLKKLSGIYYRSGIYEKYINSKYLKNIQAIIKILTHIYKEMYGIDITGQLTNVISSKSNTSVTYYNMMSIFKEDNIDAIIEKINADDDSVLKKLENEITSKLQ
jgi:hypothetical protein